MKKLFALFLVAVMCFSLVACGGDEESNNNNLPQTNNSSTQQEQSNNAKEKEVVITVDNWQEYFEITYGLKEEKDNFDKITYADSLVCSVKLKDKYASKLVDKKFEIDFEFEKSTYFWKANVNYESGTYELTEELESFNGLKSGDGSYFEQATITNYSLDKAIIRSDIITDGDDTIIQYPKILGLSKVQGTLYIYE